MCRSDRDVIRGGGRTPIKLIILYNSFILTYSLVIGLLRFTEGKDILVPIGHIGDTVQTFNSCTYRPDVCR